MAVVDIMLGTSHPKRFSESVPKAKKKWRGIVAKERGANVPAGSNPLGYNLSDTGGQPEFIAALCAG
jgi:hypothetical protein